MIDGDDYHAIALLTPGDPLNTQFLNDMQRNWVSNVADLIKGGKIKTDDREAAIKQIYAYLATSHVRDHLMLQTIIQILNKVKLLLAQIGKTNSELENLITTTTQVAKKLKQIPVNLTIKKQST